MFMSNLKEFFFTLPTKTLLVKVLLIFLIIHGQGGHRQIRAQSARCFALCLTVPSLSVSLAPSSYRLARGQASSRKGIPSTVRAAVFVLPNSIPFHSLSPHSVYFGALLHRGAWLSWKMKTSPRLPIWWHDRWKQLPLAQQKKDKGTIFSLTFHLQMATGK